MASLPPVPSGLNIQFAAGFVLLLDHGGNVPVSLSEQGRLAQLRPCSGGAFGVCWTHQKAGTALLIHDGLGVGCTGAN